MKKYVLTIDNDKMFVCSVLDDNFKECHVLVEPPENIVANPRMYDATTVLDGLSYKVNLYTLMNEVKFIKEITANFMAYDNGFVTEPTKACVLYDRDKDGCLSWDGNISRENMIVFYNSNRAFTYLEKFKSKLGNLEVITYTELCNIRDNDESKFAVVRLTEDVLGKQVACDVNTIIEVDGNLTLDLTKSYEKVPINIFGGCTKLIIRGTGSNNRLEVKSASRQPCIGVETRTGMSYGRWEHNPKLINFELVIDNVEVTLTGSESNFTLGKYGTNDMPVINYENGGKLICPETKGTRYISHQALAPSGSTKISDSMEYSLYKGDKVSDFMFSTESCKEEFGDFLQWLPKRFRTAVTLFADLKSIEAAVKLSSKIDNLDLSLLLQKKDINRARTAVILRNNDLYSYNEINVEIDKISYFIDEVADTDLMKYLNDGNDKAFCLNLLIEMLYKIRIGKIKTDAGSELISKNKDYIDEFMFEMIPSYYFDDWVRGNHYESVRVYLEENERKVDQKLFEKEYDPNTILGYVLGLQSTSKTTDSMMQAILSMRGTEV
jgi:hypothetical protein